MSNDPLKCGPTPSYGLFTSPPLVILTFFGVGSDHEIIYFLYLRYPDSWLVVEDLMLFTDYSIHMIAFTGCCPGPVGSPTSVRTECKSLVTLYIFLVLDIPVNSFFLLKNLACFTESCNSLGLAFLVLDNLVNVV